MIYASDPGEVWEGGRNNQQGDGEDGADSKVRANTN